MVCLINIFFPSPRRELKPRDTVAQRLRNYAEGDTTTSQDTSQQQSENVSVQDQSDTASQLSSLGAFGEDPDVLDKVRYGFHQTWIKRTDSFSKEYQK